MVEPLDTPAPQAEFVFSHRAQYLLETLLIDLRQDWARSSAPEQVFAPQYIVVPSTGVGRWLTQQITRHFGVAMNITPELPGAALWRLLRAVVPALPARSPFDAAYTVWAVFSQLQSLAEQRAAGSALAPEWQSLERFVSSSTERDHYMFSRNVAKLFESYVSNRPDWLAKWKQGDTAEGLESYRGVEQWQAQMWRSVFLPIEGVSDKAPLQQFSERLARLSGSDLARLFPTRLRVFAGFEVSEQFLKTLSMLAQRLPGHLSPRFYELQPCKEYWLDLVSAKSKAKLEAKNAEQAQYFEQGHALLTDWGRAQRDARWLLDDHFGDPTANAETDENEQFPNSLLGHLQHSLLTLNQEPLEAYCAAKTDHSIALVACHNPRRQVEQLQEVLLTCFANDVELKASDVLVVCPQLPRFAPYLQALWGHQHRLAFRISGVSLQAQAELALVERFAGLLSLAATRLTSAGMLEMFSDAALASCFGLSADTLERLRDDAQAAGMLHGFGEGRYSLPTGVQRLLLGAALGEQGNAAFCLPQDPDLAGVGHWSSVELAGLEAWSELLVNLQAWAQFCKHAHPIAQWCQAVSAQWPQAGGDPFAAQALAEHLAQLRERLAAMPELALSWEVFASAWQELRRVAPISAQPSGAITVVPPGALRGVPYRIIAWLGLDEGVFPEPGRFAEWDLISRAPRKGDRIERLDQRAEFLDSVLAAKEKLLLLYQGLDAKTNEPLNPSVLVQELLRFVPATALKVTEAPLWSSASLAPAHSKQPVELVSPAAVLRNHLPRKQDVSLASMHQFLMNPARWYLQHGLGVRLAYVQVEAQDEDTFGVPDYRLAQLALQGAMEPHLASQHLANPVFPGGELGKAYAEKLAQVQGDLPADLATPVALQTLDVRLETSQGSVVLRGSNESVVWQERGEASSLLKAWLLAQVQSLGGEPANTRVQALWMDKLELCSYTFAVSPEPAIASEARAHLTLVLEAMLTGHHAAVPFFPNTAVAQAQGKTPNSVVSAYESKEAFGKTDTDDKYAQYLYAGDFPDLEQEVLPLARDWLGSWPKAST
jgi:exodeoxyribonuclease V gamma subunit